MSLPLIIPVVFISSLIFLIIGFYKGRNSLGSEMKNLKAYKERYLYKQGIDIKFGKYDLISLDGGKRWYAFEYSQDNNWEIMIKGPAEEIFPGLLAHLNGFDALIKYARENGPISFSERTIGKDIEILEGAGFNIIKK